MQKNILRYVLVGLTLMAAFFSWMSVWRAVTVVDSSKWMVPIVCFSIYIVVLCLMDILVSQLLLVEIVAVVSLLMSLIFSFNLWHFVIIILCTLLMLSGLSRIRKDLDLNIKISLWKSLHTGKAKLIFALAFIISSQYFFTIKNIDGQKTIPEFDLSAVSQQVVGPLLGFMNPKFNTAGQKDMTVDEFIIKSQENSQSEKSGISMEDSLVQYQIPTDLPQDQQDALRAQIQQQLAGMQEGVTEKNKELVLREGRLQFSQMVGKPIDGSEKISDVFAGLVNKKINDYFNPSVKGEAQSPIFPLILALILFLIIAPLSSLLANLWFGAVIVVFKFFVHMGFVQIDTVTVEREMIV